MLCELFEYRYNTIRGVIAVQRIVRTGVTYMRGHDSALYSSSD
jgi:hypothetical protein